MFSFETDTKENSEHIEPKGYFNFNNFINEFGEKEVPKIPLHYYVNDIKTDENIQVDLYSYSSIDKFMDAIIKYNELPHWSNYSKLDNKIKTDGLMKALSFKQPIVNDNRNQQFINLPETLPAGYYLVDCTWEDLNFQTFIQITDISYYFMDSNNKSIIWMNDLATGKALSSAIVTEKETNKKYTSNSNGLIEMPSNNELSNILFYKITKDNQNALAIKYPYYTYYSNPNIFWKYLQTDRNLYQPDDTVELWGFLQNRYRKENIDEITLEINNRRWFFYDFRFIGEEMPLVTQKVKVKDGFFNGKLKLPNLESGGYQIEVKFKDEIIASSYVKVEKYVKPEYKIEILTDKKAVFAGEKINFITKTMFFEGTPVANLDVNYNISGPSYKDGKFKTDINGQNSMDYIQNYHSDYQGLSYIYFSAYASLPESGQIYGNKEVKVFMNDINVKLTSTLKENKATIKAEANKIVLDKLNDDDDENDDYLGEPVSGHSVKGKVYKNEWKKKEIGQYYDFINKVTVKQYDYYNEKKFFKDITLVTDNKGVAITNISFTNEQLKDCYYTVELNTKDLSGRTMKFDQYIGEHWIYSPYNDNLYILKSDKEVYDLGDKINVEFLNNEKPLSKGSYLYITTQNGIINNEVSTSPNYLTTFSEKLIPNAEIVGIYFNGKTYIQSEYLPVRFNIEKNRIELSAKTDKTTYSPGDICTIELKSNVKDVNVNISIVDEALYQLSDQNINTLESLYEWVPNGIKMTYASHKNDGYLSIIPLRYGRDLGMGGIEKAAMNDSVTMNSVKEESKAEAEIGGNTATRSEFKDTAIFSTITLDENGSGKFYFKLPDNITSWRVTLAGISKDLKAGTNIEEIIVSMPYFINTSLNSTFLVGDEPFIGVSSYGTSLKEGEKVNYEISCKENNFKANASGKAFEKVNIPLFKMEEGNYKLIIKSKSESGYEDAIEKEIKVVKTHHQKEVADYYKLTNGFTLTTNYEGMTELTFVDQGKGKFMPALYSLSYSGGKRVDQKYISLLASNILKDTFKKELYYTESVELSDYQMEDGGFGILPYASSDLETTIKLIPLIKDFANISNIKMYLYNALNEGSNKATILYGLAALNEPILIELEQMEKASNLNLKDYMYLSLAYAQLGDLYKAKEIYKNHIESLVEKFEGRSRVKEGKTEDSYLEYTALAMLIASHLNLEEKDSFFNYVNSTYSKEVLLNLEKLIYIKNELEKVDNKELTVKYTYDGRSYTKILEYGWPQTIKLPSSKLKDFKVTNVVGDGAIVAIYKGELSGVKQNDNNLKAEKVYYNYYTGKTSNEFNQSDIVKVQINWNIEKNAIDDSYMITDYVPSGLIPINNVWEMGLKTDGGGYWFRDIDGQKVSFYVYKHDEKKEPLYYYARIVNPGNFKSEGIVMQGVNVKDSIMLGTAGKIIIK